MPDTPTPKTAQAALAELVALKDLKESIDLNATAGDPEASCAARQMREEYNRRRPLAWAAARAALASQPLSGQQSQPSGYAYRYNDPFGNGTFIRFNDGREVNGCRPIESIPYWLSASPVATQRQEDVRDALAAILSQEKPRQPDPDVLAMAEEAKRLRDALCALYHKQGAEFSHSRMTEVVELIHKHDAAIDRLAARAHPELQSTAARDVLCAGDPGECSFNGACMYHCGRLEPPAQPASQPNAEAHGEEWLGDVLFSAHHCGSSAFHSENLRRLLAPYGSLAEQVLQREHRAYEERHGRGAASGAEPVAWSAVAEAILSVQHELAARGGMFPQNADYHEENRQAFERAADVLRWFDGRGHKPGLYASPVARQPLTPREYNAIPELCAIKPSLYESIVRAIERAHGIPTPEAEGDKQ